MSSVITSPYNLVRPSGVAISAMTAAEQASIAAGDLDFIIDPAERAPEIVSYALEDRRRGILLKRAGTPLPTPTTLNGQPAVLGYEGSGYMVADYQIGASYFVAAAFETGPSIGTNDGVMCSLDQASANRLFVGVRLGDRWGLVHGSSYAISTAPGSILPNTKYVAWASFDATLIGVSGAMNVELGINAITTTASGAAPVAHMGDTKTTFFGGVGDRGSGHKFAFLDVCRRSLGGVANYKRRAAILAPLAEKIGITLEP
ncbi:hypothetical protein ACFOKF_15295 [Sphingobium rhizovicinum]|uniref:DUF2793 domain-containing protein n=1 Tax=Sphingobium rhizovicinum TaxID=432308 RepID=A0ABV7NJE6_9SPHN